MERGNGPKRRAGRRSGCQAARLSGRWTTRRVTLSPGVKVAGAYDVTFVLPGFRTAVREAVQVGGAGPR